MAQREEFEAADRREVEVRSGGAELDANLVVPEAARGIVIVAGSPEHDAVLGRLARDLQEARLATLLLHLHTADEARRNEGTDGERATGRILDACHRLDQERSTATLAR